MGKPQQTENLCFLLARSHSVSTETLLTRKQTDIREIYNDTLPLWFDALDPSKINFGLAYYGRGYTLSDPSCNHLGCPFSGPSQPGPCTNYGGVLSLAEIKQYSEFSIGSVDPCAPRSNVK